MAEPAIVWEDPPNADRKRGRWYERLLPLTERPGVWARVDERESAVQAGSAAQTIRTKRGNFPAGQWEACSRSIDGHHYVYARYLGEGK